MALGDRALLNKVCALARERREKCPLRELLQECRLNVQEKIEECQAALEG